MIHLLKEGDKEEEVKEEKDITILTPNKLLIRLLKYISSIISTNGSKKQFMQTKKQNQTKTTFFVSLIKKLPKLFAIIQLRQYINGSEH